MVSIMPPESTGKTAAPISLRSVAQRMCHSPDPYTSEVGSLLEHIGYMHEHPVCCDECRGEPGVCVSYEQATNVAFAWLLKVVDERG